MVISFPYVDEALGHSIIYDEYRGNFAKARQIAGEQLNETLNQFLF